MVRWWRADWATGSHRRASRVVLAGLLLASVLVGAGACGGQSDSRLSAREVAMTYAKAVVARDAAGVCRRFVPAASEGVSAKAIHAWCVEQVAKWELCRRTCDGETQIYTVAPVVSPVVRSVLLPQGIELRFQSTPNRRYVEEALKDVARQQPKAGELTARNRAFVRHWQARQTAAHRGWFCVVAVRDHSRWFSLVDPECGLARTAPSKAGRPAHW